MSVLEVILVGAVVALVFAVVAVNSRCSGLEDRLRAHDLDFERHGVTAKTLDGCVKGLFETQDDVYALARALGYRRAGESIPPPRWEKVKK